MSIPSKGLFNKLCAIALGSTLSVGALAMPISVSYEGADVTVSYSIDAGNSQLVSFDYLFDVGSLTDAANWIGTTMDAFSVQFGSAGGGPSLVQSISATSTNSANVNGAWTGFLDKVSGQGCSDNDSDAVCYTRLVTAQGGSSQETVIAADTAYNFAFDVLFQAGVDVPQTLAGNHSIKFLSLKEQNGSWSTGLQLSESGPFIPTDPPCCTPPSEISSPDVLALLGLGLLSLVGVRHLRRA